MRRATWILWLMLALLPLRGWAFASMDLPSADPVAVQAVAAAVSSCHDAGADDSASGNCQACDWCHASLAVAERAALPTIAPPVAPPRLAAMRDTGRRLSGGLERPPRSTLA